jgi:hypothetical protein
LDESNFERNPRLLDIAGKCGQFPDGQKTAANAVLGFACDGEMPTKMMIKKTQKTKQGRKSLLV